MNKATKARAIECQDYAQHYAKQADIYRNYAEGQDCPYQANAIKYKRLAQDYAAAARAILAD